MDYEFHETVKLNSTNSSVYETVKINLMNSQINKTVKINLMNSQFQEDGEHSFVSSTKLKRNCGKRISGCFLMA